MCKWRVFGISKLMGICPHLSTIYNRSSLTAHHTAKYLNINVSQADKMSCHYFIWWKIVMEAATSFVKSNWTASGAKHNQDVQSLYVFCTWEDETNLSYLVLIIAFMLHPKMCQFFHLRYCTRIYILLTLSDA